MKIRKEVTIGLSFAGTIILFIWGFNFLKGTDLFSPKREFFALYNNVGGLVVSNPVVISGVKVGTISSVKFHPGDNGLVVVKMLLTTDFPIPSDSRAKIYSSDLMGSKAVEIVLGGNAALAASGDTLTGEIATGLTDQLVSELVPLKDRAEAMMVHADSVLVALNNVLTPSSQEKLRHTLVSLDKTMIQVEGMTTRLNTILGNQQLSIEGILKNTESFTANLKANNQNITKLIANLERVSDSLASAPLGRTLNELEGTVARANLLLKGIEEGQGTAGQLLKSDSLYKALNRSALNLEVLLKDLKENPERYVKFSLF
ncbi:MAG TPA: MlaD family protein [Bacteroidales bacterium]|nr:MlaD family protein [Bacteroidales bacterium]